VSRYVHFFWIPVFPIGKTSATVCHHCKQVLSPHEMPATYRAPVQAIQSQARTPLTNFALLLLFGAGVAFLFVVGLVASFGESGSVTGASTAAEMPSVVARESSVASDAGPVAEKVGTRYRVAMTDSRTYALAQVTSITPNSVYYRMTNPLRTKDPSDAMASLALRDSVDPGNAALALTKEQWMQITTGHGAFKRFD
jgi:hypothetical protein